MIEIAVILSGVVRHWPDFFIILLLLFTNAVVGYWEERQAGNAIAALKAKLAIKARVKRDGKSVNLEARELVPGDIIHIRLGDVVPADARLLDGDPLEVDQSALTGESLPVSRKSGEAVFSGSIIRTGEIDALVYGTGTNTYFGKTAELVEAAITVSHFQRAVLKIGNYLIMLALILVAMIIIAAIIQWLRNFDNPAVCFSVDCRGDSRSDANGAVGDNGRGCAVTRQKSRRGESLSVHRGIGRRGHIVC